MNILARNLPRTIKEADLRALFTPFGAITSLNIVEDPATKTSKGFGFIEMPNSKEAISAIKALNGTEIDGEKIRVKSTRKK